MNLALPLLILEVDIVSVVSSHGSVVGAPDDFLAAVTVERRPSPPLNNDTGTAPPPAAAPPPPRRSGTRAGVPP